MADSDTYILMMDGYIKPNKGVGYFPLAATTEGLKKGVTSAVLPVYDPLDW